jgi:cyclase
VLKKRIIFTLLYCDGNFMLSRNFRLQKVGDINWLKKNYDFSKIAFYIDELIVLDISRDNKNISAFSNALSTISEGCFAPIAAGGGINSVEDACTLLRSGADKVIVNTCIAETPDVILDLCKSFGQQCIVGSIDFKLQDQSGYKIFTKNGTFAIHPEEYFENFPEDAIGEMYVNSIDRDGTGQGYDFSLLSSIPSNLNIPIILAGGVGNSKHLLQGLVDDRVDAVATAHLFNFIGDGLQKARHDISSSGISLAVWPPVNESNLLTY